MGQSSGSSGRRTARALQDSASQNPDSSKEWMFHWSVETKNPCVAEWARDHDKNPVPCEIRQAFPEFRDSTERRSGLRRHSPKMRRPRLNTSWLLATLKTLVPTGTITNKCWKCLYDSIRGNVATSKSVNQKEAQNCGPNQSKFEWQVHDNFGQLPDRWMEIETRSFQMQCDQRSTMLKFKNKSHFNSNTRVHQES